MAGTRSLRLILSLCAFCVFQVSSLKLSLEPSGYAMFMEGRLMQLVCTVDGWVSGDPELEWMGNMGPITEQTSPDFKIDTKVDTKARRLTSTLSKVASVGELYEIVCQAGHESSQLQLTVFSVEHHDVNISVGFETSLECESKTGYESLTTSWLKDGVPIRNVPDLKDRLQIGENGQSILIEDTKPSDGGVYTCVIKINPATSIERVYEVNITAYGKPFIENATTPEVLETITNTSVILLCPAKGQPPPKVMWFKDNEVLEPDESDRITMSDFDGVESAKLDISDLTYRDIGKYTCSAENNRGKTSFDFNVDPSGLNGASGLATVFITWCLGVAGVIANML